MRDCAWIVLIVALGGCEPAVSLGDGSTGDASTGGADGTSTGAPPSSTVTTDAPPSGSTGDPETCFAGQIRACACPDGSPGQRECGPDRLLGPCECGDASTSGWDSSTGGDWPDIPDVPPGAVCLPEDSPCSGDFVVNSDEELAALSTCSRIQGGLFIEGNVHTLQPLGCLRTVEGVLVIAQTELLDLDALGVGSADTLVIAENDQLLTLDLPAINAIGDFLVLQNPSLLDLQLGNLDTVVSLEFTGNTMLPDCMIADLIALTFPESVVCSGNLESGCAATCG